MFDSPAATGLAPAGFDSGRLDLAEMYGMVLSGPDTNQLVMLNSRTQHESLVHLNEELDF